MARARSLAWDGLFLLGALGACGGCGDDTSSQGGGGASSQTGGSPGDGGGGTGGGASAYAGFGTISLSSSALAASSTSSASASFALAQAGGNTCTTTTVDACALIVCEIRGGAQTAELRSAGEISVDGALRAVTLTPAADDHYESDVSTTELLFNGGETLGVHAAGSADIPAFDGSLVAPSKVTVGSPGFSGTLTVDRAQDLTFGWTGGAQGDVELVVGVTSLDGTVATGTATVFCVVPAQPGTGVIPASLLGELPATDADDVATVYVNGLATTQLDAGDWSIQLYAFMTGVTPTGTVAVASATVE